MRNWCPVASDFVREMPSNTTQYLEERSCTRALGGKQPPPSVRNNLQQAPVHALHQPGIRNIKTGMLFFSEERLDVVETDGFFAELACL